MTKANFMTFQHYSRKSRPIVFLGNVCKTVRPMLSACLCVTLVYCGQTIGWISMPLGMEVGLGLGHTVLVGDPVPPKGHAPTFRPVCCGQTAGWIKMPLSTEVGVGQGHIVLDGNPAPIRKGAQQSAAPPPLFGPCLLRPNCRPTQPLLSLVGPSSSFLK